MKFEEYVGLKGEKVAAAPFTGSFFLQNFVFAMSLFAVYSSMRSQLVIEFNGIFNLVGSCHEIL